MLPRSFAMLVSKIHIQQGSYYSKQPKYERPITCFGLSEKGDVIPPVCRKIKDPPLPNDLNEGFGQRKPKDPRDTSKLKPVLDCLKNKKINTRKTIVTYRNNLNKILGTPYGNREWMVDVIRRDDTIYLEIIPTDDEPSSSFHEKAMYWGTRFEKACTGADESSQFCSVVRTKLNDYSVIIGAEIDGYEYTSVPMDNLNASTEVKTPTNVNSNTTSISPSIRTSTATGSSNEITNTNANTNTHTIENTTNENSNCGVPTHKRKGTDSENTHDPENNTSKAKQRPAMEYVEIKTNKLLDDPRAEKSFRRFKLLSIWIQSFLAGVPKILCGFRDDNGIVRKIVRYKTLDIPLQAQGLWDPYRCLSFANRVFTELWEKTEEGHQYVLECKHPFEYVELHEKK